MTMRVIIVDDETPARDKLRRWLLDQTDIEIVAEAADGVAAAQTIVATRPDLVFLDIQMPGMTGLEVAAQLQATAAPLLVFVTAHGDHALQAFDLNAVDYLLKPYDRERLLRTLTRVRARFHSPEMRAKAVQVARERTGASERLLVPDGEQLRLIDSAAVVWIEADDNYLDIHTGDRTYRMRRTLQDLLAQLGESQFARVHKSTAVNIGAIVALHPLFKGDYEIQLRNDLRLRLSRRYKEALFARMGR